MGLGAVFWLWLCCAEAADNRVDRVTSMAFELVLAVLLHPSLYSCVVEFLDGRARDSRFFFQVHLLLQRWRSCQLICCPDFLLSNQRCVLACFHDAWWGNKKRKSEFVVVVVGSKVTGGVSVSMSASVNEPSLLLLLSHASRGASEHWCLSPNPRL